ncbi:MAG TPA: nucleotidyl transferase AbiEii/AbiGii toxin family protein [Thermodesulfobacteriota bacterium]
MIPRAFITQWRASAPWPEDAQVEQDLVISRALVEIFSDPVLSVALAFRGGTALHKLFLAPPARYSEDIDLVQVVAGPAGPILDAVRKLLDPWLKEPRVDRTPHSVRLTYRFPSEVPPVVQLRLKVEINTREHFSVLGFERKRFAVENGWFSGRAEVQTYRLEELLGTKLRALHERKKGRDLFDLSMALTKHAPDPSDIVECFRRYLEQEGKHVSRAEFERSFAAKLGDPAFHTDVRSLLAPGSPYDPNGAARTVYETLVARIPGEPWKKSPFGL